MEQIDHQTNCPGLFTSRDCCKGEAVAQEAVVNYREPTQPNPGINEGFVVRSAGRLGRRPKGKRCRHKNGECFFE